MCCLVQLGALLRGQAVDRLIHEVVLAGPGRVVHAENVQERRLAGARRPHDRDELAILDVEIDAAQHVGASDAVGKGLFDVPERNQHSDTGGRVGSTDPTLNQCISSPTGHLIGSTTRPSNRWMLRSAWRA